MTTGATGAIIAAKRRRIIRAFHEAQALSAESAVPLSQLGVRESLLLRGLVRSGVVVESEPGRFHVDPIAEAEDERRRRRLMLVMLVVVAVVVAAIMILKR